MTRVIRCSGDDYSLLCDAACCKLERVRDLIMKYNTNVELPEQYIEHAVEHLLSTLKMNKESFDKMGLETWDDSSIKNLEETCELYKTIRIK